MRSKKIGVYAASIGLAEAVGGLAALLTREGVEAYNLAVTKPPLSPPPVVFPIAWAALYALMGFGAGRVWLGAKSDEREKALTVYALQLAVNFAWSLIFFNARAYALAFAWILCLLVLILWMILLFRRVDKKAGNLQIPYALWVSFASYLTCGVWFLNQR